jgi:hypothetical protein
MDIDALVALTVKWQKKRIKGLDMPKKQSKSDFDKELIEAFGDKR